VKPKIEDHDEQELIKNMKHLKKQNENTFVDYEGDTYVDDLYMESKMEFLRLNTLWKKVEANEWRSNK
jgi:hypothetical protein